MPTLDVTIIQPDLHWHDVGKNIAKFDQTIRSIESKTDLVILPEMFTTGFSMDAPQLAEPSDGPAVRWMKETSISIDASICGSLIINEEDKFYNRFICAMPDGREIIYDKRHLARLANEQNHYTQGHSQVTFELNGFRICPLVCYDLRFPVWSRNQNHYDLLIYVANWPNRRHHAWQTLLRARAIENLAYVAGVNRVGIDGNDIQYDGGSALIDYLGQDILDLGDQPKFASSKLELDKLKSFRKHFAFDKDSDKFKILK